MSVVSDDISAGEHLFAKITCECFTAQIKDDVSWLGVTKYHIREHIRGRSN